MEGRLMELRELATLNQAKPTIESLQSELQLLYDLCNDSVVHMKNVADNYKTQLKTLHERADKKEKELRAAIIQVDKHFWEVLEIGNEAMRTATDCQNRAAEREEEFQEYFIYATQTFSKERKLRRRMERAAKVARKRFWRFFLGRGQRWMR